MKNQADKLGNTPEGYSVTAATDSAGSQVIVVDESKPDTDSTRLHLLSKPLKNHQAAVALGKKVVKQGPEIYDEWYDFRIPGEDLFALMMSMMQR